MIEEVIRGECVVHCTSQADAREVFHALSLAKGEVSLLSAEDITASGGKCPVVRSVRCSEMVVIEDGYYLSVPLISYEDWVAMFDKWSERIYINFPHLTEDTV